MNEAMRRLLDHGVELHQRGDLTGARAAYHKLLKHIPNEPNALNLLGAIAFAQRHFDDAERLLRRSLGVDAQNIGAAFNLALVCEVRKRTDEAHALYTSIVEREPDHIDALMRLGIIAYMQKRFEEAIDAFQRVLRIDPEHAEAALDLGIAYNHMERHEEAVEVLQIALAALPDRALAHRALAVALNRLGRRDAAMTTIRATLAHNPTDPEALLVLGNVQLESDALDDAERTFLAAATLASDRAETHVNLCALYHRTGRTRDAIEEGTQAVALAPEDISAHINLGMAHLLAGDLARGWPELEWRLLDPSKRGVYRFLDRLPLWEGDDLNGERLLISLEQGIGDFIWLSRYLPLLASRGVRASVETPESLVPLYSDLDNIEVIPAGSEIDAARFAAHLPIASLPHVFGTTAQTIPNTVPYVRSDPTRAARFRERYAVLGERMRVGVVWAGNARYTLDRYRSIPLAHFDALSGVDGIGWVSLQKQHPVGDTSTHLDLIDIAPELHDFADTAAAIDALDLVITVDTAIAHVAGALGKPVWMLVGFAQHWLWQCARTDSPWYPTMRLFRAARPQQWEPVINDLRTALLTTAGHTKESSRP